MASQSFVSTADFGVNLGLNDNLSDKLVAIGNLIRKTEGDLKNAFDSGSVEAYRAELEGLKEQWIQNGGAITQAANQAAEAENKLADSINAVNTSSYQNFRAIGQADRITREFASGGLTSGLNGLTMFGNSLTRLAAQEGGFQAAIGGLADAFMGPAGIVLLISAAVGAFEAYSKSEKEAEKNTVDFGKTVIDTNKEIKEALDLHNAQITSMKSLVGIATDYTVAENTRTEALKRLKSELSSVNKEEADKLKTTQDIISASYQYIEALKSQQLAEVSGKRIAELDLQIAEDRNKVASTSGKGVHLMELLGISDSDVQVAQARIIQAEGLKRRLEDINKSATIQSLNNPFSANNTSGDDAKKQKEDKTNLELLKSKQAYYKDDIYMFSFYADQIVREEGRLEVQKAKSSGAGSAEILRIQETTNQKLLNNEKLLGEEMSKIAEKQAKEEAKQAQQDEKDLEKIQIQAAQDNITRIEDDLKVQEKIANRDFEQRKNDIKNAMADISASMEGVTDPKSLELYNNALEKLLTQLKLVDAEEKNDTIKQREAGYKKFAETISRDVTQGLVTMWDALQKGKDPLEALGNMIGKIVEQLAAAVVQAVILETILEAFGLGGAAEGGGGFIKGVGKILGFADGGIVNKPTLAMVGEGSQSEAIMPLSKLGNVVNNSFSAGAMSGGSQMAGGQFTLRGNDLVLALQRSNYSLDLRRGA